MKCKSPSLLPNVSNSDPSHNRRFGKFTHGFSSKKQLQFPRRSILDRSMLPIQSSLMDDISEPSCRDTKKRCVSSHSASDMKVKRFRRCSLLDGVEVSDENIKSAYFNDNKENIPLQASPGYSQENIIPLSQDTNSPHMLGFLNQGNTCYLNAVLQSLFGLQPFMKELITLAETSHQIESCPVTKCLYDVIKSRADCELDELSLSLKAFKSKWEKIDSNFAGHGMHDANEFLVKLLDTVKEELNVLHNLNVTYIHEKPTSTYSRKCSQAWNAVDRNFCFVLNQSFRCTECKTIRIKEEEYSSLNVCVPEDWDSSRLPSIQDALDFHFKPELRELHCDKCGNDEFTSSTTFKKLPRVLILQLKRYKYYEACHKLDSAVEFNFHLSVDNCMGFHCSEPDCSVASSHHSNVCTEVANNENGHAPGQYVLFAVICHHGSHMATGHYVADVLNLTNKSWYHYNDEEVTLINEEDVLNSERQENGYMFFYVYNNLLEK